MTPTTEPQAALRWLSKLAQWHPFERSMVQRRAVKMQLEGIPRRLAWALAVSTVRDMAFIDGGPMRVAVVCVRKPTQFDVDAVVATDDHCDMTEPRLRQVTAQVLARVLRAIKANRMARTKLEAAVAAELAVAPPGVWYVPVFTWGHEYSA